MDVVLQQRVPGLGLAGEVVSVKTGYARHFLIPQGMAVFATESTVKEADSMREEAKKAEQTRLETLRSQLEAIQGKAFTLVRNADENGQLYGSVSSNDVHDLLKEEGFAFEENDVSFAPQKHTGTYQAMIKPEPDSKASVLISIVSESEAKEVDVQNSSSASASKNEKNVDEEPKEDKPIVLV